MEEGFVQGRRAVVYPRQQVIVDIDDILQF
jgi:hypothetical protein